MADLKDLDPRVPPADEVRAGAGATLMWFGRSGADRSQFSAQWLAFVGRTLAEEIGRGWADNLHPEDRARCLEAHRRHAATGEPYSLEFRLRRGDGSYAWCLETVAPLPSQGEMGPRVVGVCVDVTAARRRAEADRRSAQRHAILHEFTDAIVRSDSETEVYERALDAVLKVAPAQRASVLLLDEGGTMRFVASRGLTAAYRAQAEGHSPWRPDEPNPQPVLIEDVAAEAGLGPLRDTILDAGIRACGFFPLVQAGRLLGKFMLYFDAPHRFAADEVQLAHSVAGQVAFALERKRGEIALRETTALVRIINETSQTLLYTKDRQGRNSMVNTAMLRALGKRRDEAIGQRAVDYWDDAEAAARIMANDRQVMDSGEPGVFEERIRLADGTTHTFLSTKAPQRDAAGNVVGIVGASIDITEQKRIEERLRESQAHLRLSTEAADVGTWQWDLKAQQVHWSAIHMRLWGYAPREGLIDYEDWARRVDPVDLGRVEPEIRRALAGEADYDVEYRIVPEGQAETRWIRSTGRAQFDDAGEAVLLQGVSMDITARKRADERQALLIQELNHRVKNTLAVVQSIAAQTLRGSGRDKDARRSFEARLMAVSSTHNVLTRESWEGADLADILATALSPHRLGVEDQFAISGPPLRFKPKSALSMAMALHELATNAVKYGALSAPGGRIAVSWTVEPGNPARFKFRWEESGGPPVARPKRRGFGTRLIVDSIEAEFDSTAELHHAPGGIVYTIDAPLGGLLAD